MVWDGGREEGKGGREGGRGSSYRPSSPVMRRRSSFPESHATLQYMPLGSTWHTQT